ncbi:MAG: hypothetical protein J1F28_02845 [Oscillospiraceae bacterium]|nr:hypothetical protein [Oscillospiraceae bacterium]
MDFNKDINEVVNYGYEIVKKQLYPKDTEEMSDADIYTKIRNTIKSFVEGMRDIEIFSFIPFEIMSTKMVAKFVANNLIKRGVLTKDGEESTITGYKKTMSHLKKEEYYKLCGNGSVQTFIVDIQSVNTCALEKFSNDIINVLCNPLHDGLYKFKNSIKHYEIEEKNGSDYVKSVLDICELKSLFNNFWNDLDYYRIANLTQCPLGDRQPCKNFDHQFLYAISEAVNHVIYETMLQFILYNPELDSVPENYLNMLKKYIDTKIKKNYTEIIDKDRKEFIDFYKNEIFNEEKITQDISLNFAYYLNGLVNNDLKRKMVKSLDDLKNDEKAEYNSNYESFANDPKSRLKYFTESNNPSLSNNTTNVDIAREVASLYHYDKGFDAGKNGDLTYVNKVFYFVPYELDPKFRFNKKRLIAKELMERSRDGMDKLRLEEREYLMLTFSLAHFRHHQMLGIYKKFYDVYLKLNDLTVYAFRTLNPARGMVRLLEFVEIYLKFFEDNHLV